jgi:enamine deaminase RidA (YjgF/YER057c/UK114 family)
MATGGETVKIEHIDPAPGFTHVVTTEIAGVKTIHVSGQVGVPLGSKEPGADLAAQAEIAFQRVVRRVEQAGATTADIVKTTVFIKDITPDKVRTAGAALVKVFALEAWPASTWVGVTGLVDPRYLIEVEAMAVVAAG